MKPIKKVIAIAMTALSLSLVAPQAIPFTGGQTTAEAASFRINKKKAVLLKGKKLSLKVNGTKKKFNWRSSDPRIASVSKKGKVTAKTVGYTVITATRGNWALRCNVYVENPTITKKNIRLKVGDQYALSIKGNSQKVKWSTSDKSIATVSSGGVVIAKKTGQATIRAKISSKTLSCKVIVSRKTVSNPTPAPPTQTTVGSHDNPINLSAGSNFTYKDYKGWHNVSIRLLETITGETANQIVQEENMFNEKPTASNSWVLYHYNLHYISGDGEISASDIINKYYFYDATASRAIGESCESAVFSGTQNRPSASSVRLYPGGSSDVWVGLLLDNSITGTTLKKSWYDSNFKTHELWFANK